MTDIISLRVNSIEIGERHRALSDEACDRLAASIKDIGLRQPISVRVLEEMEIDGKIVSGVPVLVAGRHRLEAVKRLGWTHIECIEVDDDAIKAELWEIAENLHRLDLTKEQRDEHIRRYAELLKAQRAAKSDKSADFTDVGAGRGNKGIATEIAENTGISQRTVRRALAPKAEPVPPPPPPPDPFDAFNKWSADMNRVWGRAPADWRALWLEQIDTPIMDQRYG